MKLRSGVLLGYKLYSICLFLFPVHREDSCKQINKENSSIEYLDINNT